MRYRIVTVIIAFCFLLVGLPATAATSSSASNLDTYVKYFYNRYSKNFDTNGLQFVAPWYGIPKPKKPDTPREWVSLASYYKYRAIDGEVAAVAQIRNGVITALNHWQSHPRWSYSFHDGIASFLAVRMVEQVPSALTPSEVEDLMQYITGSLFPMVVIPETENRALISGAYSQYLANYLTAKGYLTAEAKVELDVAIKKKIDGAVAECINSSYWYMEGKKHFLSPHYHTVSAFMLMFYADQSAQPTYAESARRMYLNIKKVTFRNGLVESRFDSRPVGLGAQFYLMQGLLGRYSGDDDYRVYLSYANGSRFFSNRLRPNMLEYHSTLENTAPEYHDDYSFVNMAEAGLVVPSLRTISLQQKAYLVSPITGSGDPFFRILNTGRVITVNNKKNTLGSYGNYSRMVVR